MIEAMRESEKTTERLPISFALSLCTGVTLFGLLHMLITVNRAGVRVSTVRDIVFRPIIQGTICLGRTRIDKPVLEKFEPPPESPPITIDKNVDFLQGVEPVEFDAKLLLGAYDVVP